MAIYPVPAPAREFDLRHVVAVVWSNRFRVLAISFLAGAIAIGVSFLVPKWYRATAVIMPPDESDLLSNLSLASKALAKFPAFGVMGDYFTPADVFKAVLNSRTAQEHVVDRFALAQAYKTKTRDQTLRTLRGLYTAKLAPDGTITVTVEDQDPKRAAAMAMAFIEALDRFNIEVRNTRARRTREFLEQRVHETDSLLRVSEATLRLYQESRHTVVPATSPDMNASADLMARKILLEVRLGVLRSYMREDNDEIRQVRTELQQLKGRIQTLPGLQSELARLIRDAKVQEQLYLLLTAELEQARIRETMDTPTIQVLDRAIPPERHSRPRKSIVGIVTAMLAFAGSVLFLVYRQYRAAAATPAARDDALHHPSRY
jgi:tyrosine-protein kinase Etk/Wzc